ncbi:Vitamin B12 transporter BtuB precursor [Brevundimonas sp. SH203]|uniref:TonB-dependent receptor domain-containing protein n=1 Tax=Brevundimonas sp. SH203 TaxID=345167 RepID=UPI0009CFF781|nr:TonB-dependent receptor [Brevundimonas sp. SH203]GAW40911.1 Vitamin B12 transporter BtuB precursor [Brevundimonas sp. SH203]
MNNIRYRRSLLATTIIGGAALAMAATPSFAQSTDQATEVGEIVVTGSRIARQDYRSTSPIVTVSAQDFQATGAVTIDSLINDLPQFTPSISSTSNNPSNGGQANINLRNLGSNRTLVLMNGRRVVPSNSDGTVDVNLIPTALIKNIEVISGGASAAYGSDALAGVANFILDENFSGVQFDAQYGETDRSDGKTESYSITVGGNFDDDRGNMVLSLGRSTRGTIYNAARDFSKVSGPSGTSPLGSTIFDSNNLPSLAVVRSYFNNQTLSNTDAFGFNDDNTLFAYPGKLNVKNPAGAGPEYTAPGANYTFNTGPLNYLQLPLDRYNVYGGGRYKINENAEVYANALFTQYVGDTELAASPAANGTGFRVPATNPFIPADLRTFLNARANPNGSFLLNKRFTSLGGRHSTEEYNIYQITAGVRGQVPQSTWTYDVYGTYGRVSNTTTQTGNVSRSSVQRLLDAADGGRSLCSGGFDPFGVTDLSADCISYIGRSARNSTVTEQRVIEASLQGKAFDLPAGEVRVALGAQYRQDDFAFGADSSLAQSNAVTPHLGANGQPDGGNIGGSEIAGFNPTPSLAGGTQAYRAELDWTIAGGLRARGGYSRSVRAPSIGELFATASSDFPNIGAPSAGGTGGDPCDVRGSFRTGANAAAVKALCLAQGISPLAIDNYQYSNNQVESRTGGNPNLKEETSDSWSVGLVYQSQLQSPWLSGFSASIDYYNIEITDAIGSIKAGDSLKGCFNVTGENPNFDAGNAYCQLFRRDSLSGNIVGAIENKANLGMVKTSGIDLQADWTLSMADIGAGDWGRLKFNTVISWLENYEDNVVAGGAFTDRTGTIDSSFGNTFPEWKALTSVTWSDGPFSIGARWRRIGEITVINTTEVLPSIDYFDLNGSWAINDTVSLRGGVNNLTDEQPNVFVPGVQANTDPSTYDVLGRRYYVGLTAKF